MSISIMLHSNRTWYVWAPENISFSSLVLLRISIPIDLNRRLVAMKKMDFVLFSFLCVLLDFAVGACTRCGCSNSFSHAGLPGKPGRDGRDGPPGPVGPPGAGQFGTPSTTMSDLYIP